MMIGDPDGARQRVDIDTVGGTDGGGAGRVGNVEERHLARPAEGKHPGNVGIVGDQHLAPSDCDAAWIIHPGGRQLELEGAGGRSERLLPLVALIHDIDDVLGRVVGHMSGLREMAGRGGCAADNLPCP